MDKDTIILNAIMGRYGGLVTLSSAVSECMDTVLVNLEDDIWSKGEAVTENEIEAYIHKVLG